MPGRVGAFPHQDGRDDGVEDHGPASLEAGIEVELASVLVEEHVVSPCESWVLASGEEGGDGIRTADGDAACFGEVEIRAERGE